MTSSDEAWSARFFGFASLLVWAVVGSALELAHGLKLSAYLDHPLRRELLRLAHAHGVGLSLVVLAFAAVGIVDERSRVHGRRLRIAAVLMPVGFLLSVFGHAEADPGPAIWLVPIGAAFLLVALVGVVRALGKL